MDVDPSTLASRLEELPRESFESFVVALFRARGWTVDRTDGGLRATDRFGTEYALHVGRVDDATTPAVEDLLVTADAGRSHPDVRVVGPDDLHRLLRYAVDRETARVLYVRTFGRPPVRDAEGGRSASFPSSLDRRTVVVVLVALVGLSLASLGGGLIGSTAPEQTPETTPADAEPTADGTAATAAILPPGVARDGSVDAAELARAHRDGVEGRSYRLVVTYREFGDATTGRARERIVVESANVYATEVFRTGTLTRAGDVVADAEAYAEGGTHYRRVVDDDGAGLGTRAIGEPAVAARYADRVATDVRRYLAVERSTIVTRFRHDGRTHYWLAFHGDEARDVTGSAVVDDRGVVHSLRRSADLPGETNRSAVLSIRYEFGDVRATPPAWYERARNRSGTRRADLTGPGPALHSTNDAP